ncbi:MAG: NYN domain-containing protein [Candidatus Paceibacterota bacterium]|jgi:uncharacterized LabA/DUF88 family protein|nr:NYN domain-containing protein [Candidatus Pacearchaeota archaeon]MDD5221230.1 NYN domain-containing protein [Candidatus Paceibacterota bacterium]
MNPQRIFIFIDASNLWEAQKSKGRFLDYIKTIEYIRGKFNGGTIKVFYFTAYPREGTRDYSLDGKHKFFTFLEKGLKFNVTKKKLKRISVFDENGETIEEKGNMDVEITIAAMHNIKEYDMAIFFTGDSDFLPLVTYLKNNNKKVFIFSSKNNISQELRFGADDYQDILDIKNIWGKELKHREKLK